MYCDRCQREFRSKRDYNRHVENSSRHNHCKFCPLDYTTYNGLLGHYVDDHYYCHRHGQQFQAESNIRAHLRGAEHMGRNVECCCGDSFPTVSAFFAHIEQGGCQEMSAHALMHNLQLNNVDIYDLTMNEGWGGLSTDKQESWLNDWVQAAWDDWECVYTCHYCEMEFDEGTEFEEHIRNASKHDGSLYYDCENCYGKSFKFPSQLAQHYESGKCT